MNEQDILWLLALGSGIIWFWLTLLEDSEHE